jgi:anti-sigma regulatory factor (Ser/Thr protein kinase)
MCSSPTIPARLRHDAFVYDADDAFADGMVPFLQGALDEGDAAVAITTRANIALLQDALGSASDDVSFVDRDEWYTHPARAVAGWDRAVRTLVGSGARLVRAIGEVRFGDTPRDWDRWTAYESVINHALAHHPAWVVCPYDSRALPEPVVEHAARTHPELLADGWQESPAYDEPARVAREFAHAPQPVSGLTALPVPADPGPFRTALAAAMRAADIPADRAANGVVAAEEVLANAGRHGRGARALRVGTVAEQFVCEITDNGYGHDDPLAGYAPPRAGGTGGAGLWVARQLTADVELISSPRGLTVRLWI